MSQNLSKHAQEAPDDSRSKKTTVHKEPQTNLVEFINDRVNENTHEKYTGKRILSKAS
jgi:hypothetical protein